MASIETVYIPVAWKESEALRLAPPEIKARVLKDREDQTEMAKINLVAMLESEWRLLHTATVEDTQALYFCYQFFNPGVKNDG